MGSKQSRDRTQPTTHLPFLLLHTQSFRSAAFVIVATEVQYAMDQQRHELFL
ncbi:MAG TPA: hypothetical protein VJR03_08010 [Nitrospira sp.]|nr:hypothetical protein [Nitrospira sp.]